MQCNRCSKPFDYGETIYERDDLLLHVEGKRGQYDLITKMYLCQPCQDKISRVSKHSVPDCAPGCDYPVTGYHAKRGGEVLCAESG